MRIFRNDSGQVRQKCCRSTKRLEEKEAKRPSRKGKIDINGLRSTGAGIHAQNARSFAQEAAEGMTRTSALAEFVENALPVTPKGRRVTTCKKRLRLGLPDNWTYKRLVFMHQTDVLHCRPDTPSEFYTVLSYIYIYIYLVPLGQEIQRFSNH